VAFPATFFVLLSCELLLEKGIAKWALRSPDLEWVCDVSAAKKIGAMASFSRD
jgi:hypothetical protein